MLLLNLHLSSFIAGKIKLLCHKLYSPQCPLKSCQSLDLRDGHFVMVEGNRDSRKCFVYMDVNLIPD